MDETLTCYGCKWYHEGGSCNKCIDLPEYNEDCFDYEDEEEPYEVFNRYVSDKCQE